MSKQHIVAQNRKAYHDYFIEDKIEAGMILVGSEVKSLRSGKASLLDAYASFDNDYMVLFNAHIPEYKASNQFNHEPLRPRRLLLRKRQFNKLIGSIQRQGMTLIPLSIYFNDRGIAKVELGLAKGKRQIDKRNTEKERDWNRQKAAIMKRAKE
ncbi:MAG: SsrA-binding protein SmpB [Alphaproteobacteria bacterium]|nr:SsrA-binding protein SmpB [Alphaproteobacteria bacterium]